MQTLPAELWENLKHHYPTAFEHFGKWIDEYKKEVDWDALFWNNKYTSEQGEWPATPNRDIKFHDLPIDMQNGIIARYELELNGKADTYISWISNLPPQLHNVFLNLENKLLNEAKDNS